MDTDTFVRYLEDQFPTNYNHNARIYFSDPIIIYKHKPPSKITINLQVFPGRVTLQSSIADQLDIISEDLKDPNSIPNIIEWIKNKC